MVQRSSIKLLKSIEDEWVKFRGSIEERIDRYIDDIEETEIVEATKYIYSGGKRFRGYLTIKTATILGANPDNAMDAAVAVELVHASSLALDDIIDEDTTRRGKPAAWIKIGLKKTVMVSNLLIPFAQRIVHHNYGVEALLRTVKAWMDISRGEVLDAFSDPRKAEETLYLDVIKLKTGSLFRLACELGAIAARKLELLDKLSKYGEILGMIYQIADDINDIEKIKTKPEPSLLLFQKWIKNNIDIALEKIIEYLERIEKIIESLELGKREKEVLRHIPLFILSKIFSGKKDILTKHFILS